MKLGPTNTIVLVGLIDEQRAPNHLIRRKQHAMDETIKAAIKTARDSLNQLDALFEDLVNDLPEQAKDAQQRSRVVMQQIREQLDKAAENAEDSVKEAQVQAHLGVMEAKERIEATRPVVEEYLKDAAEKSKTVMDEAELRAKLAAMEAEDFWETQGKPMSEEFQKSAEQMASIASAAATDLQSRLERWVKAFEPKK